MTTLWLASMRMARGRFLAPDPLEGVVGDPQSWNRYAYVENDPINLSDPSGQGFWEDLGFAILDIFLIVTPGAQAALPWAFGAEAGTVAAQHAYQLVYPPVDSQGRPQYPCRPIACAEPTIPEGPSTTPSNGPEDNGDFPSGDPGTQGPTNGGATSTASGPNPTPGGGTISNPSGGGIWDECGASAACMGRLSWAANYTAGAGEFLTAGITSWINGKTGAASVINTNSGAYRAGFWTGVGLTAAETGAGTFAAQAVNSGRTGMIYGRGGNALLNSGRFRFGWGWKGSATAGYDVIRIGIGESKAWYHSWTIWEGIFGMWRP
jgi:hypothetical protein